MKKLLILFLALVIVGGLAFGGPINITLSATSTLKWRLVGTLLDNAPGAIWHPLSGVTTSQSSEGVSAHPTTAPTSTGDFELAPATLYLTLDAQDANKVSIVRAQSTIDMTTDGAPLTFGDDLFSDIFHYIEFPNVVPGMVGVMLHKKGTLVTAETTAESNLSYPNVITTITPIKDATVVVGLIVFPQILHVVSGAATTEIGNVADFALSLDATYKLAINDKDSATIGFGTIYDTSWNSGLVIDSVTKVGYAKDIYKAYVAKQAIAGLAFDEKTGWLSIPFGLTVGLSMSGLTVDAAAQARLATGFDALNLDLTNVPQAFQMPLYGKLAVSYKLTMDTMTITPAVTFKYSSDFWKWHYNSDYTVGAYEYMGDVAAADIIGRPMSLAVSVPVIGIAKMLDATVSATLGFGDALARQGAFYNDDATANLGNIGYTTLADWIALVQAATVAKSQPAGATTSWATGYKAKDAAPDAMAYKLGLVLTLKPMTEVMVKNETYYNHDGFGVVGSDTGVLYGGYLNRFQDIVTGEYYLKVADAVAATFYGIGTFTIKYFPDATTTYSVADYAVPSVTTKDVASQMTLGYEVGVKVSVKY